MDLTARQRRTAAVAALLGNALEWYDFAVYGYVASALGKAFFPAEVPVLQTMASFAVFAVGYLMRPVGSLVLGPLGDLLGRRLMLSLSIVIMGLSSLAIGLLPTHSQIGITAGILLMLLRMLQGFSVGGEFTGSITYASEAAARGRAGLLSSVATAGGLVGFSLGSLTAAVVGWCLGQSAMEAWGWRLPFLLGALVAALGAWMRRAMPETLQLEAETPSLRSLSDFSAAMAIRLRELLGAWRLVLQVMGLVTFANVVFYLAFVFLVDFTGEQLGDSATANSVATLLQTIGLPLVLLGGALADRWGLARANRWSNLALMVVTPIGLLIGLQGTASSLALALAVLLLPLMATMGAQGVLGVALVPVHQRCAVFSIGYSLAMALFAGSSPLVATWFRQEHVERWAIPAYALVFGLWALVAVRRSRLQQTF